jgi:hypothetical protein
MEDRVTVWYKLMTDIDDRKRAEGELENAFEEIKRLKDRFHDENVVLREQIDQVFMFEEIVGSSPALKTVLSNIMKVAPTRSERATDSARADDCSDCERSESLQGHRSWIGRCSEVLRKEKIAFIPWFPMAAGRVSAVLIALSSRIAARSNATPSQVAVAWLLVRSLVILPIPGTSKVKHLEENVAAAALEIDANTMGELDGLTHAS